MNDTAFPRTIVGGVSLSRMVIGTNWFLGFSHTSAAKDSLINSTMDRKKVADIIEVFLQAGVDTIMGLIQRPLMHDGIQEAQQRTGKKLHVVSTPGLPLYPKDPGKGLDWDETRKLLDTEKKLGAEFCFPHMMTTDALMDRMTRKMRFGPEIMKLIRERGMIPGLSTHMPESIIYADESGLDVETYISLYNSMGFLMQVEVDWIQRVIMGAKKPVMTIKPFAAGQLRPFQALYFVWNTLREQDMVTVGTLTPDEAKEVIDLSMTILSQKQYSGKLQETRSKASIKKKD